MSPRHRGNNVSPRVLTPSTEELRARRAELLERAGMDRDKLGARAEAGTLSGDEFWLFEDVRSIEFLLGDSVDADD